MDKNLIGVLHPGEMGAAVGACLTQRGLTVLWASAGAARPPRPGRRPRGCAMWDSVGEMSRQAEVMLVSVSPAARGPGGGPFRDRLQRHLR